MACRSRSVALCGFSPVVSWWDVVVMFLASLGVFEKDEGETEERVGRALALLEGEDNSGRRGGCCGVDNDDDDDDDDGNGCGSVGGGGGGGCGVDADGRGITAGAGWMLSRAFGGVEFSIDGFVIFGPSSTRPSQGEVRSERLWTEREVIGPAKVRVGRGEGGK
ncbi:uncharacterized protein IWZ02DRAFT_89010 [Phyllosticta citriasiana]|uniref:uncharacterized protein n=1 Tax=Phyllosticta citriasiana TaxID=595635 RepID=UPI0030FDEAB5